LAFGIQFFWSCFLYLALFPFLLLLARSFFAPRLELMAEILALRQQLAKGEIPTGKLGRALAKVHTEALSRTIFSRLSAPELRKPL